MSVRVCRTFLFVLVFTVFYSSVAAAPPDMAKIPDNDVYLMTEHLWGVMQRFQDGELLNLDVELEKEIELHPNFPSSYLWAALPKVRRLFIDRDRLTSDTKVLPYLQKCIETANNVRKIKELKDAGTYHLAMCEAGLAFYSGIERHYLDARNHGVSAFNYMQELLKSRPNLHGALLVYGIYNFYTGIFGPFTKAIMYLIGFPTGDLKKGIRQVESAAAPGSPFRFLAQVFLTNLYSGKYGKHQKAADMCELIIREHPKSYLAYMLKGEVMVKYPKWEEALAAYRRARSIIPLDSNSYAELMVSADVLLIQMRIAFILACTERHTPSLQFLHKMSTLKSSRFNDGPLLANVFLGHIYSLAGKDREALAFYKAVRKIKYGEWVKDMAEQYEDRPKRKRSRFAGFYMKNHKLLKPWLDSHPEIRPAS